MRLPQTFLRPVAHRGLHDAARGRIENSEPAFAAAIARGYGIECDLRPAAGGLPIVFHDETLERLVDGEGAVAGLDAAGLARLRYRGQDTAILTFTGLLDLVAGRVPLLVEVKSEWEPPDTAFLAEIARLAKAYEGPLALMSFDPAVMAVMKDLAPRIPRGIVSGGYRYEDGSFWWPSKIDAGRARRLANLEESGPVEPDFYAYHVKSLPQPVTELQRKVFGLPLFTWTVRTAEDRAIATDWADAPIFEGFEP
jgi:glycerophosphoryl diester phosphodiesterase